MATAPATQLIKEREGGTKRDFERKRETLSVCEREKERERGREGDAKRERESECL
jgi:hypothetical protein